MRFYIFLFCLLLNLVTFSQTVVQNQLVNNLPASPTANFINRFNEIPVDVSTGVPNVSIPLFDVESRKLSFPINLNYHAGGVRYDDVSSVVGLGWTLNVFGLVSRLVLDKPDEGGVGQFLKAEIKSKEDYENLLLSMQPTAASRISTGSLLYQDYVNRDKVSDRYSFSAPILGSGNFRFDFVNNQPLVIPFRPIKVDKTIENNNIIKLTIVNEEGTVFIFSKVVKSSQTNYCASCYNGDANTSWYLTKIVSHDGVDEIKFEYESINSNQFSNAYFSQKFSPKSIISENGVYTTSNLAQNSTNINFVTTSEPILKSIKSAFSEILFEYESDRVDLVNAKFRLKSIRKIDLVSNNLVKHIVFRNDGYFGAQNFNYFTYGGYSEIFTNQRLKLSGIDFKNRLGGVVEQIGFDYFSGNLPPYNSLERLNAGNRPIFSFDLWGFYNGENNGGLIPSEFGNHLGTGMTYGGNRRSNPSHMKIWTLKSIEYPTKGKTEFDYESNYAVNAFSMGQQSDYVGGLRIKSVSEFNRVGNTFIKVLEKKYSYSNGQLRRQIDLGNFVYYQMLNWDFGNCYGNVPIAGGSPVLAFAESNSQAPLSFSNGNSVFYGLVTEEQISGQNNSGKTEYFFQKSIPDFAEIGDYSKFGAYFDDYGSQAFLLVGRKDYLNEGGTYKLVQSIENEFEPRFNREISTGVTVVKTIFDVTSSGDFYEYGYLFGGSCPNQGINPYPFGFSFENNFANSTLNLLKKSKIQTYGDNASLSEEVQYEYGSLNHSMPTSKISRGSGSGKEKRIEYSYTSDATFSPIISQMLQRNLINHLINEKHFIDQQLWYEKSVKYNQYFSNLIEIEEIEERYSNSTSKKLFHETKYDQFGNLLQLRGKDGVFNSFIFGYKNRYPIIEAQNISYDELISSLDLNDIGYNISDFFFERVVNQINNSNILNFKVRQFQPSVGIISEWVSGNYKTGFIYDSYNRLIGIRNNDGFIVKKYCYSIDNIIGNCPLVGNVALSSVFFKDNCQFGYGSSPISYQISANKYYGESEQEAQLLATDDLNRNGQAYANANGTCSQQFFSTAISDYFANGSCASPEPYYVTLPYGQFTSSISQADADNKAYMEAQRLADQYGACLNIVIVGATNYTSTPYFITFTSTVNNDQYTTYVGENINEIPLIEIPVGSYTVSIQPMFTPLSPYSVYYGCDFYNSNVSAAIVTNNVFIGESCNMFYFND
jgi:hypothetical protein